MHEPPAPILKGQAYTEEQQVTITNVLVFFKGNEANIKKEFYSLTEQDYGSENE